ncbi:protein rolling stone [Plakobranchus ocellatus]|uniref:Protein rolling stone n=1 Tax=Plakobranchus ocellatus TaxID=259542 RepID=A0AAV3Z302_9GAST|nr:protein rolling stone [Plakobranchus ocellatus]
MAFQVLREEFRLKNFGYNHPDPSAFYRCQWRWPAWLYLCIRLILALYMVGAYIAELVNYYETAVNRDAIRNISSTPSIAINTSIWDDTSTAENNISNKADHTEPSLSPTERPAPGAGGWDTRRPWYVFFTLWSYTVLVLHLVVAAILSVAFSG